MTDRELVVLQTAEEGGSVDLLFEVEALLTAGFIVRVEATGRLGIMPAGRRALREAQIARINKPTRRAEAAAEIREAEVQVLQCARTFDHFGEDLAMVRACRRLRRAEAALKGLPS